MLGSSALVEQNPATYGFTTVINKTNIGKVNEYCVNLLDNINSIMLIILSCTSYSSPLIDRIGVHGKVEYCVNH